MSEHTLSGGQGATSLEADNEAGGHGVARIAAVAALGGFLFGYDSSVINGAVSAIQTYFHVAAGPLGFAVASALLGAALGAIFAGRIADRIGRLKVMRIAAVLFLIAKQRIPEARKILTALLGEKNLEIKINRIRESLAREKPPAWRDLKGPALGLLPIVWVGLFLSIFQQFVGINVIFYYSNVLWHAVGFSSSASFLFTVISAIINIATTIIAIATVDKIGRKPLLLVGSAGMFVTLGTMAYVFGTAKVVSGTPSLGPIGGPVALVAANLFVVFFGMSWGPCVWVLLGEMFPNRIRAAALGLAAAGQWVANWVITVSFPTLKDISLGLAYGIYATCALLSLLFVMRWVKETKGKQLEEMTAA